MTENCNLTYIHLQNFYIYIKIKINKIQKQKHQQKLYLKSKQENFIVKNSTEKILISEQLHNFCKELQMNISTPHQIFVLGFLVKLKAKP